MFDEDFLKAQYALLTLRHARLSQPDAAAEMIQDLAERLGITETRTPEIEDAHIHALMTIGTLAESLSTSPSETAPELWQSALRATERWKAILE